MKLKATLHPGLTRLELFLALVLNLYPLMSIHLRLPVVLSSRVFLVSSIQCCLLPILALLVSSVFIYSLILISHSIVLFCSFVASRERTSVMKTSFINLRVELLASLEAIPLILSSCLVLSNLCH